MDLDQAADELYALPADQFSARRTELVAQARADKDRPLARDIGKLKKPVLSAALVNALVRSGVPELAQLPQLGQELRAAHAELQGQRLRELSERRRELLDRLVELARDSAGQSVTETVLTQLRDTFEAAIADETAETAVLSGRLNAALSYSGFGGVDVGDAVSAPVTRRLRAVPDLPRERGGATTASRTKAKVPSKSTAKDDAHRQREATRRQDEEREAAQRRRQERLAAAEQDQREAQAALDDAQAVHRAASERLGELADQIEALRAQVAELTGQRGDRERDVRVAERAVAAAERDAQRAAERLKMARRD